MESFCFRGTPVDPSRAVGIFGEFRGRFFCRLAPSAAAAGQWKVPHLEMLPRSRIWFRYLIFLIFRVALRAGHTRRIHFYIYCARGGIHRVPWVPLLSSVFPYVEVEQTQQPCRRSESFGHDFSPPLSVLYFCSLSHHSFTFRVGIHTVSTTQLPSGIFVRAFLRAELANGVLHLRIVWEFLTRIIHCSSPARLPEFGNMSDRNLSWFPS